MHRRRILRRLRGHAFHDDLIISEIDVAGIALALAGADRGHRLVVVITGAGNIPDRIKRCTGGKGRLIARHIGLARAIGLGVPFDELVRRIHVTRRAIRNIEGSSDICLCRLGIPEIVSLWWPS